MTSVLALDIGGTTIAAAVADEHGALLRRTDLPTPEDDTAEGTFDAVAKAVEQVCADVQPDAVGISAAGPVDHADGSISPINIAQWQRFPVVERVRDLVGGVPVSLATDGQCTALGEQWMGAARGASDVLGVVVSTGVGGGLVAGGQAFVGRTGNAGHIGHVVVEPDGEACACGGRGCVETVASGPAMVRWARVKGWQAPEHAHAEHLAAAAKMGEEIAKTTFWRAGCAVGYAIAAAASICDLDLAVVGGGVARSGRLLFDPIRQTLATHARLSFVEALRVVPAELGTDAGLAGAAALALRG